MELRKLESNPLPPTHDLDVSRVTEDFNALTGNGISDPPSILYRARISSHSVSRMPYVGLSGMYNKRWYVDTVALPNDSIRALLSKLFSMLNASVKIALDMSASDFERVRVYLAHFHRYISAVFEAEEKFLYTTFEGAMKRRVEGFNSEHPLYPDCRKRTKREVIDAVSSLLNDQLMLDRVASVTESENGRMQLAEKVREQVDGFCSKLLVYFSEKEKVMPKLVFSSIRGDRERNRQERLIIKFFSKLNKGEDEFFFAAILAVPLKVEVVREDFTRRHFGTSGRKRDAFLSAVDNVNNKLLGVVDLFEDAEKKYKSKFSVEEFLSYYGDYQAGDSPKQVELQGQEISPLSNTSS